jgi:hypothetical protein
MPRNASRQKTDISIPHHKQRKQLNQKAKTNALATRKKISTINIKHILPIRPIWTYGIQLSGTASN